MDGIKQGRPNESPISNSNKRHRRQSLNKKFGTNVKKSTVSMTLEK